MQQCFDMHPDLALLLSEERRGICCYALEGAAPEQVRALSDLGAFCTYQTGDVTALLYAEDGFHGEQEMGKALSAMGLQAGLSGPFALAASARGCMLKARLALATGRLSDPERTVYPMDEYGEAALVRAAGPALRAQGFDSLDFCDAVIGQMVRMDAQKDTQYVRSLRAYLNCGMDMKRAAEQLGVHRNTLAYRMERVQAIFNLDFKDVSRCFELLFSLWLTEHLPAQDDAEPENAFDVRMAQAALWAHVERESAPEAAGNFACALLCAGVGHLLDEARASLIAGAQAFAPQEAAFAFDEDVLLVALAPEAIEEFARKVGPLCAAKSCPVVVTQAFSAARIDRRATICRMALCAAGEQLLRTQDLCSTLFFMALERKTTLAPYLCEQVIRVMDDDAQKGTALSRSLYAYLLNFRDMKRAAQQMSVHRNTMEYHMRKIDTLIGEAAGEEMRFMMMCTYKMLALPEISRCGLTI